MPDGLDSSSTNIASDHGVGNTRRSIADHLRQVGIAQAPDLDRGGCSALGCSDGVGSLIGVSSLARRAPAPLQGQLGVGPAR